MEFATLAGFDPAAVLCELTNSNGSISNRDEVMAFGEKHQIPVVTIEDLIAYRREKSK